MEENMDGENTQEFYLISIPKKIKTHDLEGFRIDLKRNNQTLSPPDDDEECTKSFACDIQHTPDGNSKISRIIPNKRNNDIHHIDEKTKIIGCINVYKQLS